jgi:hypothetical protein
MRPFGRKEKVMMKRTTTRKSVCVALAVMMMLPCGTAFAAGTPKAVKSVVTGAELYEAMSARTAGDPASRESIQKLLDRSDVRRVAARAGIDLGQVRSAVSVLSGQDLQVVANQAQRVNDALVGGSGTVVVTSTALIIGLLVLIIVLVA